MAVKYWSLAPNWSHCPTVNTMQAPRHRAPRRGLHRPARAGGVHLPRRGERAPAEPLLLPEDG